MHFSGPGKRIWERAPCRSCLDNPPLVQMHFSGPGKRIWNHAPSRSCLENPPLVQMHFPSRENASGTMLLLGPALRIHRSSRCIFSRRENASGSMLLLGAALRIHRSSRCIFRGRENASGSMLLLGAALRIQMHYSEPGKRIWEHAVSGDFHQLCPRSLASWSNRIGRIASALVESKNRIEPNRIGHP